MANNYVVWKYRMKDLQTMARKSLKGDTHAICIYIYMYTYKSALIDFIIYRILISYIYIYIETKKTFRRQIWNTNTSKLIE